MLTITKKILAIGLALALLGSGFFLVGEVNRSRESLGLTRVELPDQARPDLLTTVLFSVGRALAVDYLWIGLQQMQNEGRYFDANQRAEWICQLQPNFPQVWIFQSWNMAYNISVAMTSGADRWRWVLNGIELLRDRGIPLNPKAISLYRQLAWTFHHKIGAMSDDYHWYYKMELAREMEEIIGWPDAKYDQMGRAPETWEELVKDTRMAEFIGQLREFQIDPLGEFPAVLSDPETYGERVVALMQNPANQEQIALLEGFIRGQRLRREWKMDPKIIAELRRDDMFGPLDFRDPNAHAIYWSFKGLRAIGVDSSFEALVGSDLSFEAVNTNRIIYGALQEMTTRGRFRVSPEGEPLIGPDLRFIPVLHRFYLALGKNFAEVDGIEWDGTAGERFVNAHVNYLRKSIAQCFQYGNEEMAQEYWRILNKLYPHPEYRVGMENYIFQEIREDMKGMTLTDANNTIRAFLQQAYVHYARDDDYNALAMERLARTIYRVYMQNWHLREQTGRMTLAPWGTIQREVLENTLHHLPEYFQERLKLKMTRSPETDSSGPTR